MLLAGVRPLARLATERGALRTLGAAWVRDPRDSLLFSASARAAAETPGVVNGTQLPLLWARVLAQAPGLKPAAGVERELAPGSLASSLVSSVFSAFEVAFLDLQARSFGILLV